MEVLYEVYVVSVPVSCSVMLMRYSLIMPCVSSTGGGLQERDILLELIA